MKKLVSLLLAALMAALLLSSCAVKNTPAGNSASSGAADTDTAESAENKEQSKRDLLFTWQIKIDGVDYTLPFDYSEIHANGYSFDESRDIELGSRTYALFSPQLHKDDINLNVQFWNPKSEKVASLADSKIGNIEVNAHTAVDVILPGGLKYDVLTLTLDTLREKYGEPDNINDSDDFSIITYSQSTYSTYKFTIYKSEEKKDYGSLDITNFV